MAERPAGDPEGRRQDHRPQHVHEARDEVERRGRLVDQQVARRSSPDRRGARASGGRGRRPGRRPPRRAATPSPTRPGRSRSRAGRSRRAGAPWPARPERRHRGSRAGTPSGETPRSARSRRAGRRGPSCDPNPSALRLPLATRGQQSGLLAGAVEALAEGVAGAELPQHVPEPGVRADAHQVQRLADLPHVPGAAVAGRVVEQGGPQRTPDVPAGPHPASPPPPVGSATGICA